MSANIKISRFEFTSEISLAKEYRGELPVGFNIIDVSTWWHTHASGVVLYVAHVPGSSVTPVQVRVLYAGDVTEDAEEYIAVIRASKSIGCGEPEKRKFVMILGVVGAG